MAVKNLQLVKKNNIYYIENSTDGISFHMGICSREANNYDYGNSLEMIRKVEKEILSDSEKIPEEHIFFLNQVHKDGIIHVDYPEASYLYEGDGDAMTTRLKNLCLVIRTADCVPVLITDREKKAIGAVHSGWRSTELNITGKTIKKMMEIYGSRAEDLSLYILPAIGIDSYEVSLDVASKFPGHYVKKTLNGETSYFLDLKSSIKESVTSLGILPENIFITNQCTSLNNDIYFSHRRGDAGRNLNFIYIGD